MTIEARKISFVKDFLRLEDEDIIKELESTLKQKKAAQFSKEVSAMSMDQFQKEIDTALEDSKAGRSISTTSLKEEIKRMGLTAYWTQFAQDRLKEIFDYYELKVDLSTAQNITNDIVDSTISLEDTPQKGQKEDLLKNRAQEFRYIICNNYKIIYWIDEFNRRIEIAHVFHCRRNPVVMLDFVS